MDYRFLKSALSSMYGMSVGNIDDLNPETMKTGIEIGNIINRIDETKQNVSRETKPIYYNPIDDIVIRKHIDSDGNAVLICTNFVCGNYSYFEGTCISECTWCDNPYHCKYKNVSRETFYTIPDIWHYINFCSAMVLCPLCCVDCKITTRTRCLMYDIAMDMIFETGVC